METSPQNEEVLMAYKEFVDKNYKGPIDWKLKDATHEILKILDIEKEEVKVDEFEEDVVVDVVVN